MFSGMKEKFELKVKWPDIDKIVQELAEPLYRHICFENYPEKCVLCNWRKVVEVHHIDGNHENNEPKNLIPLCPNHHRLTITDRYKDEVAKKVKAIADKRFPN